MTLAELRGGVILRLGPRDKIPVSAVDLELHNATGDILAVARMMRNEKLDRIAYVDTPADLDIYPYPEDAEELRSVFFLNFGKTPIPMTKIQFKEQAMVDWVGLAGSVMPFTYCDLPDRRIRVMNTPVKAGTDTLMFKYMPRPRRLVKADDEPNLPSMIHECIIPRAIVRMASYDGIGLSHPASFNIYKKDMEDRLSLFLQPESIDGGDHIVDLDPHYPGGA